MQDSRQPLQGASCSTALSLPTTPMLLTCSSGNLYPQQNSAMQNLLREVGSHADCPPLWSQVWPMLVDYFYRDSITISQDNVCALLALSRQLLVGPVCQYCSDFVAQHLTTGNCIAYLRQAEKYQLHDIQQQAVALAAQGEPRGWHSLGRVQGVGAARPK